MSQSDASAPHANQTLTPPHSTAGGAPMDSRATPATTSSSPPPPTKRNWHPKVTTDAVQAACQVVLVVLGIFGYFYTVVPVFDKTELDNQIATLTKEQRQLKHDNSDLEQVNSGLQQDNSRLQNSLDTYKANLVLGVKRLFLADVVSKAEPYKCSPTVYDNRSGEIKTFPAPVTGAMLIEDNLNDTAFDLLEAPDRAALLGKIKGFAAQHTPADELGSAIQIQHVAALTGPLAIATYSGNQNPFVFCQTEVPLSQRAFAAFGRGLTALQATLTNGQLPPIQFSACPDLGQLPQCPGAGK
jgi:hypothetical protein